MSPFSANHKVVKVQSVYYATDLAAAGILAQEPITGVGWLLASHGSIVGGTVSQHLNNIRIHHSTTPGSTQRRSALGPAGSS